METTGIWDSRNNRHATVEHETLKPCPFCDGMPRIDDDEFFSPQTRYVNLPDLTVGASVPFAEMIASGMAT